MSKKKKVILLIGVVVLVLMIFGFLWGICEGMIANAKYDIKVSVEGATSTEVKVTMECTGPYDTYGLARWHIMEKKTLIGWEKVELIEGGGFGTNLDGGNRNPIGEERTYNFTYNWVNDYGELPNGIYRLRWNIDKYDSAELVEEGVGRCYITFVVLD